MKLDTLNPLKTISGELLHIKRDNNSAQCISSPNCHEGDMLVVYMDKHEVAKLYHGALKTLDLPEKIYDRLYDFEMFEQHRTELTKQLKKIKLWNYPPDTREDVRKARQYLHDLLDIGVPFGESMIISADEIDEFVSDERRQFGVYTVTDVNVTHEHHYADKLKQVTHTAWHQVEEQKEAISGKLHSVSDKIFAHMHPDFQHLGRIAV